MPFSDFENAMLTLKAWRLAVLGIAVLLIRRLPAMLALYKFIPDIKTFREAIFAGFFGPMARSSIVLTFSSANLLLLIFTGRRSYLHCHASTFEITDTERTSREQRRCPCVDHPTYHVLSCPMLNHSSWFLRSILQSWPSGSYGYANMDKSIRERTKLVITRQEGGRERKWRSTTWTRQR